MTTRLQGGDVVLLTTASGRTVEARVAFAMPNGRAGLLRFNAVIDSWAGHMPVVEAPDGTWRALDQVPVTITRRMPAP